MWLRKSLGLLLAFSMAHVVIVGRVVSCDKHEAQAADMANMHHADADAGHGTVPQKKPCDVPATTKCCDAVTSCAVAVTLPQSVVPREMPLLASLVIASIDEIPLSRVVAPDPPPPKV